MGAKSTPVQAAEAQSQLQPRRRRYHSPLRRQRAAETRDRILAAAAALVRSFETWDWRELTFRAVAEAAGVSESTVYRHFASERELHNAVMQYLEEQGDVSYEGVTLDEIADVAGRVFALVSSMAASAWTAEVKDPSFTTANQVRRQALRDAVEAAAPRWSPDQRDAAAGVLDLLLNPAGFERLSAQWRMNSQHATDAIRWVIELVIRSVRDGEPPPGAPGTSSTAWSASAKRRPG